MLYFMVYSGASSFGSVFRNTDDSECEKVLELALKSGVNLVDVAPWYGHGKAETVLGKVLNFNLAYIPHTRIWHKIIFSSYGIIDVIYPAPISNTVIFKTCVNAVIFIYLDCMCSFFSMVN